MRTPRFVLLAVGMMLPAMGPGVQAADESRPRRSTHADPDARVHAALYKSLCDGVILFNSGKHAASAYFFEGAATSSLFMLEHRPELQKAIQVALEQAAEETPGAERAKMVYRVLMDVYDKTWPSLEKPPLRGVRLTLWDRMGGEEGVTKILDDFVETALRDKRVNFTRNGQYLKEPEQVEELKRKMVDLASDLGKGPRKYKGKTMREAHPPDMHITDAEFDALEADLKLTLLRNGLAAEDVMLIVSAFETTRRSIVTAQGAPRQPRVDIEKTLWQAMGEDKGARKVVDEIVDKAVKDERVNFSRDGKYPMTPEKIQALKDSFFALASAIGNGKEYKGKSMLDAHKGMGITDAEFDAFIEDVAAVLKDNMDNEKARRILLDLVETKRKDIVEKPRQGARPVGQARPARAASERAAAHRPQARQEAFDENRRAPMMVNEVAFINPTLWWMIQATLQIVPVFMYLYKLKSL